MKECRIVCLYPTTHAVMHAAQVLEGAGVGYDIIPRPKGLDADCGIAISIAPESLQAALTALEHVGRQPSRIMEITGP